MRKSGLMALVGYYAWGWIVKMQATAQHLAEPNLNHDSRD